MLFDQIFKYAPSGFVTVWAKNETGSITRWFDLSEANALHQAQQAAIDLDARGYDAYFSTCPARSSGENGAGKARIKAADVACVAAFFMDIDTLLDGSKLGKKLPAGVTEAVAALDALPCPPTVCVSSGHGVHAYWVLREPMAIASPQDLESAKKLLRTFADAVMSATGFSDCDAHASEPSRVLRVAGTRNHKGGQLLPVDGGKIPYATRQLAEQFRDLGMIAVDFLQHEALNSKPVDSPVEPDGTGEIHELVGMNAEEAFSLGEFIKEGRGELIGNVMYHKPSGLFDAKVRFLKGWAD